MGNFTKLAIVALLLAACGPAEENRMLVIMSPNIDGPGAVADIPSDTDIPWGPYTCDQYRIAPDERLLEYEFTDEESYDNYYTALATAVALWNSGLGKEQFVFVTDDICVKHDIAVRVSTNWFDPTVSGVLEPNRTGGFTVYPNGSLCSCAVTLNPNMAGNWRTIAHELGHCLGLGHNEEDPNSLMSANYSNNSQLSRQLVNLVVNKNSGVVGLDRVALPLVDKCAAGAL